MKKIDLKSINFKKIDLKNFTIENIVNYIGEHRVIIVRYILSIIILVFLGLLGVYGFKAYNKYQVMQKQSNSLAIVVNPKLKKIISENRLRSTSTIVGTINILYKDKVSLKTTAKILLYLIYKKEVGRNKSQYKNSLVFTKLFHGIDNDDINKLFKINDYKKFEGILKSLDSYNELLNRLGGDQNIAKKVKFNFYNMIESNGVIGEYIKNFPDIRKISNPYSKTNLYKHLTNVVNKLYVYELIYIESGLRDKYNKYNNKLSSYQSPYNNFLSFIYFPDINIWINKFSGKINVDIFGGKYLSQAGYIDINLMNYWTKFFEQAYRTSNELVNMLKKNEIEDITVGKLIPVKENGIKNIVSLPISARFGVANDSSFYGLISKLTSTSNKRNIMLISEFTYYLWKNIDKNIENKITKYVSDPNLKLGTKYMITMLKECTEKNNSSCSHLIGCKLENCRFKKSVFNNLDYANLKDSDSLHSLIKTISAELENDSAYDFTNSTLYKYYTNDYYDITDINKLIGARLTDCINGGYCNDILTERIRGDVVSDTIEDFVGQKNGCKRGVIKKCIMNPNSPECITCRYKFVNKFDTNYFIAYTLVNHLSLDEYKAYDFISRLKDVYKNIPGLLELGTFTFSKVEGADMYMYKSNVSLKVFYRYISNNDISNILNYIGKKKCKKVTKGVSWSLNIALSYVNDKISNLYKVDKDANALYDLKKLREILTNLNNNYKKSDNLNKVLSILQAYRIFKEKGYCGN